MHCVCIIVYIPTYLDQPWISRDLWIPFIYLPRGLSLFTSISCIVCIYLDQPKISRELWIPFIYLPRGLSLFTSISCIVCLGDSTGWCTDVHRGFWSPTGSRVTISKPNIASWQHPTIIHMENITWHAYLLYFLHSATSNVMMYGHDFLVNFWLVSFPLKTLWR